MGSAFKNKGVQALLDAVARYLPSPLTCALPTAVDADAGGKRASITPDPEGTVLAMAFKITDEQFGQLTYTRIYRGTLKKGRASTIRGRKKRFGSAEWCGCTPTIGKISIRPTPEISWP